MKRTSAVRGATEAARRGEVVTTSPSASDASQPSRKQVIIIIIMA